MPGEIIISHLASSTDTIYNILSPHYTHCILDGVCSSSSVSPLARDSSAATQWPCEHFLLLCLSQSGMKVQSGGPARPWFGPTRCRNKKRPSHGPAEKFGLVGWAGKSWMGEMGRATCQKSTGPWAAWAGPGHSGPPSQTDTYLAESSPNSSFGGLAGGYDNSAVVYNQDTEVVMS